MFKQNGKAHDSAITHVQGQSTFIDDRPFLKNEIFVDYVGTPTSSGIVLEIDFSESLKIEGILSIFSAKDIHQNAWGTIIPEQPILVDKKIGYKDEPILIIASTNKQAIVEAKKLIKFKIDPIAAIYSIDEAIEKKSFIGPTRTIARGDVKKAFSQAPHMLKGTFEIEGQEHFYLESQAAIAYPLENNQLEVHASSQHPTETQHLVAETIGIPFHQVVCIVKRMGGGFGGKESQAAHFAAMAALAAHKLKRPARLILTKDDDMKTTGKRHPFKINYEVAFNQEGKILGLKVDLFSNAGAYADLSPSIMERAMLHSDGCYFLENVEIHGTVCRTNMHSNTAFRGFGGPQGIAGIENILEEIAYYLQKDPFEIRLINIYQANSNLTPYGQEITYNPIPELYQGILTKAEYKKRKQEIETFNLKNSQWIKGLGVCGTKFGIAFTAKFLNQANALINVHLDGTVQVSTGATEMGQGVNTKIAQIVALELGIDIEDIKVMATSTEKNHNTSPTAASSGSDLNGMAASLATKKIKNRLAQVALHILSNNKNEIEIDPNFNLNGIEFKDHQIIFADKKSIPLTEVIKTAYFQRVALGDYAFYKTPGLGFDKEKGFGRAFNYFTNGVALSEVMINKLTGELKLLRTDILMDLGRPINRAIDLGQVSGAFVQAQGWVTTEKLVYAQNGELLSHSPTTYKIPNIQDAPRIFNIDLIHNEKEGHDCIGGSKAVGEPPFVLGISVWTAVKNALSSLNSKKTFELRLPATQEEILMWIDRNHE